METHITGRAALLLMLSIESGYGAELRERIAARSHGAIVLNDGTLYPTLRQLELEGLIERQRGDNGRQRYVLTEEGEKAAKLVDGAIRGLLGA